MAQLTKGEAARKANAIKKANPDFHPAKIKAIIEKQNGPLVFDGEPFYFKSDGKGGLAIESVAVKNARKAKANTTRNKEIRRKTPKRQEFIDRAKVFFEENNLKRLDGKTARQYGNEQYIQAREALKAEKTRIKELGLTAGHIDPAVGGETLERPGNYFAQLGSENFADRNRVPTPSQKEALQVGLPRETAIDRMMGFGQDLPKYADQEVDAILKNLETIKLQNNLPRFASKGVRRAAGLLPFAGAVVGGAVAAGQAMAGETEAAKVTLFETAAGEVPVVGDIFTADPAAVGTGGQERTEIELQKARQRAANPTAADKFFQDPLNELEYIGKQLRNLF